MKKIICLLLILVCAVACVSCGGVKKVFKIGTLETIKETVESSAPTKIVTRTEYVGVDTLSSMYITQKDRASGKAQFDFEYQRYATVEEMIPGGIKTVSGTVYYAADGTVSSASGESWSADEAIGYLSESLNLEKSGFKSHELSDSGNDLKAYVSAEDSLRVFGSNIDAEGDILLEVDTNGKYLYNVKISYTAKGTGATVVINTSYDYSLITLD
ncbi:MAG: hypothetical protein IJY23_05900 [Clostridia bacterium]|nr:hypothetical protein [Clostridia bacterium]